MQIELKQRNKVSRSCDRLIVALKKQFPDASYVYVTPIPGQRQVSIAVDGVGPVDLARRCKQQAAFQQVCVNVMATAVEYPDSYGTVSFRDPERLMDYSESISTILVAAERERASHAKRIARLLDGAGYAKAAEYVRTHGSRPDA